MVSEEIIVKYLAGEAEPHEAALIREWLEAADENRRYFAQLEKIWTGSASLQDKTVYDTDRAWKKVEHALNPPQAKGRVIPMRRLWMAAASLALLLTLGILFFRQDGAGVMLTASASETPARLELSDGSEVTVKNGVIGYPKTFGKDRRRVVLSKGTAYFKVVRNERKPFEIQAGMTTVTVLGTEFEISTEPEKTRVSVNTGRVLFKSPSGEILLTAGKSAVYNAGQKRLESEGETTVNDFAYATGRLEFRNLTLREVSEDLSRYYGKTVLPDPSLLNCRMTATFEKESLDHVLDVIRATLGAEINIDSAGVYRLSKGKECQP